MKKEIIVIYTIILIVFTACETTQNSTSNSKINLFQKPDLTNVSYGGGDGKSIDKAIKILNAKIEQNGVPAEYAYINKLYGERNIDWTLISQSVTTKNQLLYDNIQIQLKKTGDKLNLYFDITEFYGKFN